MKTKKVKIFQAAKGFWGRRKNCWSIAIRAVHRAWAAAYVGRRLKARAARQNWIQRINAAARAHGVTYSYMIKNLPVAGVQLNRKVLAELAAFEPYTFRALVCVAGTVEPPRAAAAVAGMAVPAPTKQVLQ